LRGVFLSRFLVVLALALPVSTAALADESRQIPYGDIPSWVLPQNAGKPSPGDALAAECRSARGSGLK
jgi:hypothetical protein